MGEKILADEMMRKEALVGLLMGHPFGPRGVSYFQEGEFMLLNRVRPASSP